MKLSLNECLGILPNGPSKHWHSSVGFGVILDPCETIAVREAIEREARQVNQIDVAASIDDLPSKGLHVGFDHFGRSHDSQPNRIIESRAVFVL